MSTPPSQSPRIAVSLPPSLHAFLVEHAEAETRSVSNLVAHVLDKWARGEGYEPAPSDGRRT